MAESIRILHVDDDSDFVDLSAVALAREAERVRVETAQRASDGLDRLAAAEFDCIVSDYEMPGQDGLEFLDAVRAEHPDLPFILFTGKGSEELASDAISAGVSDYLQKGGRDQFAVLANRVQNLVEKYRAEQARDRHRVLIEESTDVILVVGPDGTVTYASPTAEAVLGRPPAEIEGRDGFERIHPDEHDQVAEEFAALLDEPVGRRTVEFRYERGDGTWIWLEARGRNLLDSPVVDGLVVYARDVTARKRREQELERYETLVETINGGVFVQDENARYTYVNSYIEDQTGYDRGDLIGKDPSLLMPEEDIQAISAAIGELWQGERDTVTFETEITTASGDTVPAEGYLALLPADGGFRGTVGVIRNITDQKRREETLRRLHEVTRTFMERANRPDVADQAVRATSLVLDQPVSGLWVYDEEADSLEPMAVSERGRAVIPDVPTFARGEGLAWDVFESGTVRVCNDLRDEPGRYNPGTAIRSEILLPIGDHGIMIIGRTDEYEFDETEVAVARMLANTVEAALDRADREARLRAQHDELQRTNDRLDEFASIVSHDLRNPLSVAQGRLELATDDCDSEHLTDVSQAHDRMEAMIDDLLTLAHQGEIATTTEPVTLDEIVPRCWQYVETADARLVVDTDRVVRADPGSLKQLLENLLRNAVHHGGTDAEVTVGDLADGFYLADDGPGIAPDDRDAVFDAGYSTAESGTGFGLSIVEQVAEAHGWAVEVTESRAGGARFEFTDVEFAAE